LTSYHAVLPGEDEVVQDGFSLLAAVFHAATSIYLSGVFDYEIAHWNNLGIPVPTLTEGEIQDHRGTIVRLTSIILDGSNLSPVLLLFPLRVAGARSYQPWQQMEVLQLLGRIEGTFAAAGAFTFDLGRVWKQMVAPETANMQTET
jgi:hypothetical protein